jgi:prophage tail gpP-like protein
MPDKIELQIGNVRIQHFLSYQVDADIYTPAAAFQFQLSNPETDITAGMDCKLYVNDALELTGIVDKVNRKADKNGVALAVAGRDLMGIAVDSYCEDFISVAGKKLKDLAELLLSRIYHLNRINVVYQENVAGKLKKKSKVAAKGGYIGLLEAPQRISQIEPGMTIFEVLKPYAQSRGMLFYSLPDGTFVFGRPKAMGEPAYTLHLSRDGIGNNVIESEKIDDISKRYSKYTIMGQQQGQDVQGIFGGASKINTKASVTDPDFPFYKPFVGHDNNDQWSPQEHARMRMEKHRREGMKLEYKVARYSQNGKNWTINELCQVKDEVQKIDKVYLIYGRTFELSKNEGPITRLKLGPPGLVA